MLWPMVLCRCHGCRAMKADVPSAAGASDQAGCCCSAVAGVHPRRPPTTAPSCPLLLLVILVQGVMGRLVACAAASSCPQQLPEETVHEQLPCCCCGHPLYLLTVHIPHSHLQRTNARGAAAAVAAAAGADSYQTPGGKATTDTSFNTGCTCECATRVEHSLRCKVLLSGQTKPTTAHQGCTGQRT